MNQPHRAAIPRLSEARTLLPLIRTHVAAQLARCALPVTLDLLPVIDDDVFGYELLPDCGVDVFLIVGRDAEGAPVVRQTNYGGASPSALRLAAVNGRTGSWRAYVPRAPIRRRDERFDDYAAAAASALTSLRALVRDRPAAGSALHELHAGLERALTWACARLAQIDPAIQFFGLPNEAQMGFPLVGDNGARGRLAQESDAGWTLQWSAADNVLMEWLPRAANGTSRTITVTTPTWERRRRVRRADAGVMSDDTMLPFDRRRAPGRRAGDPRD